MTLGTKLHNLRTSKGISLEKLAFELEISKTAIGKWEADKAKPSIENLLKICNYYETDIYKLLENVSNINFSNVKFKVNLKEEFNQNFTLNTSVSNKMIEIIVENQNKINEMILSQNELIFKFLEK